MVRGRRHCSLSVYIRVLKYSKRLSRSKLSNLQDAVVNFNVYLMRNYFPRLSHVYEYIKIVYPLNIIICIYKYFRYLLKKNPLSI